MDSKSPVLTTLIYESIFEFPLKKEEIWRYLISDREIEKKDFEIFTKDKKIYFDRKTKFYYLEKDLKIFDKRKKREKYSREKLAIAEKAAASLMKIPTINLISISGSLALNSADRDDDIDLFLITEKNTVWITRLICVLYLKYKGIYRGNARTKDKVCLNMIIDYLVFPQSRRDLYNAFEIAQLRPIFDRKNSYKRFLISNSWIMDFLPNTVAKDCSAISETILSAFFVRLLIALRFEEIAKFMQKIAMKKITNETVTDHVMAFHPNDSRTSILSKFEAKMREY